MTFYAILKTQGNVGDLLHCVEVLPVLATTVETFRLLAEQDYGSPIYWTGADDKIVGFAVRDETVTWYYPKRVEAAL